MRKARFLVAALLATPFGIAAYGQNDTAPRSESGKVSVNIESQPLQEALRVFGEQTGLQILFRSESVATRGVVSQRVAGNYSPKEAIEQLLGKTGLKYEFVNAHTIRISEDSDPPADPPAALGVLEEIIVTAQKKAERALDVPVPLTVVDVAALADSGAARLQDYYATVPGLSLQNSPRGGGTEYITLRGLSTNNGSGSTVAMTIDDVPVGASSGTNLGQWSFPDIDPSDLARIEVLKGPQGTLYGADSLGGVIKVVTQDPSTAAFGAHVQILGDGVSHGGAGYGVRGSVNLPLSDELAMRASAFYRGDPGYIDNVATGQDDVNSAHVYGARLGGLWQSAAGISLKLGALFQSSQGFGNAWINSNSRFQPVIGELSQTSLIDTGGYDAQMQLYTATLSARLGSINLVSVSGYSINKWYNSIDLSGLPYFFTPYLPAATAAWQPQHYELDKFSQELRLSASVGTWLDWLAGAFYTHERNPLSQNIYAADVTTGQSLGAVIYGGGTVTFHESALFGDLTVHVTDRFDVQVGGRESWNHQSYHFSGTGPLYNPPVIFTETAAGDAFTYLVTPEFKFSPDFMVYARLASGYRIGGTNFPPTTPGLNYPLQFGPDKTTNYDLGVKGSFFERSLTFDASVYYINWRDIQVGTTGGNDYFQINGGGARSQGLEASVQWHPLAGTTLSGQGSVGSAALTEALPAAGYVQASRGDRLPYSIPRSGSVSVEQDLFHSTHGTGFIGATLSYVGRRLGEFQSTDSARLAYPAYTTANMHVGLRQDPWLFNLFINNIGDRRGVIGGTGNAAALDNSGYYATLIQPRTVGLTISRDF